MEHSSMLLGRRERSAEVRNRWVALASFAVLVALLGGSSRPDAVQIVALRPIAALFLIPALYFTSRENLQGIRTPLTLLLLFMTLMILQLVPLPPAIWQSLSGRDAVVAISEITETSEQWRPLSLVPARTLNALASLVVPIAALILIAAMGFKRNSILLMVAAIGFVDALLGIIQLLSTGNQTLYVYAITNMGSAVGLFANQNHSAVFSGISLLVLGRLLSDQTSRQWFRWQRAGLFAAWLLVLLSAMAGGSRAGLLAALLAVISSGAMFAISFDRKGRVSDEPPMIFGYTLRPSAILISAAFTILLVIGAFLALDRIPALNALIAMDGIEDLRWMILPTLREMIASYWLFGSGFGSFEEVYHIFEPTELLRPAYVNQAHNDWAQLLIEGGVLAVLLAIAACAWMVRRLLHIGGTKRQKLAVLVFWITALIILLIASLVDYPLRTPLFQFVGVSLLVALCREKLVGSDENG